MKDIKGYEKEYAVTSCGKVWSYKSKKFLRPHLNENGYLYVNLCKEGKIKHCRVNRLVAETYIPNPDPEKYPHCGHKDEIRTHNWVSNLYWTNSLENNNYGHRNERLSESLSKPVYCEELDRVFKSATVAADELNLNNRSISACCTGRTKSYLGQHWRFATETEIAIYKMKTSLDKLTDAIKKDLHLERIGLECNALLESAC